MLNHHTVKAEDEMDAITLAFLLWMDGASDITIKQAEWSGNWYVDYLQGETLTPTTPNWENSVESFLCRN